MSWAVAISDDYDDDAEPARRHHRRGGRPKTAPAWSPHLQPASPRRLRVALRGRPQGDRRGPGRRLAPPGFRYPPRQTQECVAGVPKTRGLAREVKRTSSVAGRGCLEAPCVVRRGGLCSATGAWPRGWSPSTSGPMTRQVVGGGLQARAPRWPDARGLASHFRGRAPRRPSAAGCRCLGTGRSAVHGADNRRE